VVLKIKHTQNFYAETCKHYSKKQVIASIPGFNNSDFTPLPLNSSCSRNMEIDHRPPVNISYHHTTTDSTLSAHHAGDENCPSGLLLAILCCFWRSIKLSLLKKKMNLSICLKSSPMQPLVEWLPVEADQLKALFA